jgi:serine/threonine protein kinase
MAEVFAGHVIGSHGFQKPVAIKRLLPELANDHVFVERLIGEAKLLVGMTHGNIVSVLDLARDGDDVFLVMEFVDGPSLRQLLKARGSRHLSIGTATYIVQAAAAGLEFAHARPGGAIIHADISPSNLLLTTSGEVRVADFGIARREGGTAGVVEGKWAYMAPEQARGEPLTPRSDVFALGVVLYELITGQHPFGQRVTSDERDSGPIRIAPPRVVNANVPAGLDAICMKALAEDARNRYPRMQHMIDALLDERFANQYREGANDLAQAIREIAPGGVPASGGPRTMVTDRPVTIVTRSLISQPHRASSPRVVVDDSVETFEQVSESGARTSLIELPSAARTSSVLIPPSGARTAIVEVPVPLPHTPLPLPAAPLPLPPTARLDGTPPPNPFLASMLPSPELASVHGGSTVTGASIIDVRELRASKWTFAVLGIAALIGVIAAIAIQIAPSAEPQPTASAEGETKVMQVEQPTAVELPAVEPTVPVATQPAPEAAVAAPEPAPIEQQTSAAPMEPTEQAIVQTAEPVVTPKSRKARSAPAAKKSTGADATLRVNVNGQKQYAPGAKFKVPAGRYTVKLSNPDLHLTRQCRIDIGAGQVMTLKVELEEGACDVSKY